MVANQPRRAAGGGAIARQLNFHQLYIFQMVANHLSFSRAAEAMSITQPAVWYRARIDV